ncbi:MAG: NAD-dependent deacylase [Methylocystis sp.]|uniref:NAD-dependent deacylase n=1 Tax=Methylocystis sp. TaxID=1911079 RepID=UPI0039283DC7
MNLFILTGAGVSAESGLGVFRGPGAALWKRYNPIRLATPEAFAHDPALVHDFYNTRRRNLIAASPNAAHVALARLEAELARRGGAFTLVTQNIDDLHERAGSKNVIHMHGELLKARCASCGAVRDCRDDLSVDSRCGCGGALRPHVVWFGETPLDTDEIYEALAAAEIFVAIGTSGAVYPAAGFVRAARARGRRCCELNLEPSGNAEEFDDRRYGAASEIVPSWVEEILAR